TPLADAGGELIAAQAAVADLLGALLVGAQDRGERAELAGEGVERCVERGALPHRGERDAAARRTEREPQVARGALGRRGALAHGRALARVLRLGEAHVARELEELGGGERAPEEEPREIGQVVR